MENEDVGEFLNLIGNVLAQDKDYPLDGTFLYVEAASGSADMSIFKDIGDNLVCRWPMKDLFPAILDLWDAAPADKKWSALQYRIEGGRFEASFTYDLRDPEETTLDRRERVLQQRYGNKRIDYPPIP
jgi:hypothetical protein